MRCLGIMRPALLGVALCLWTVHGIAQELTPRAYLPAPKGVRVGVVGYSLAGGDILFDPSIPLYGVDFGINTAILAYLQICDLANRTARILLELPYLWGTTKGFIGETPAEGHFSGIGSGTCSGTRGSEARLPCPSWVATPSRSDTAGASSRNSAPTSGNSW